MIKDWASSAINVARKVTGIRPIHSLIERIYFLNLPNSGLYWEQRYRKGGNSGGGSYGRLADFKAQVINDFISEKNIRKVIDFGCGDGNQVSLIKCKSYIGFDVSKSAIMICRNKFGSDKTKSFFLYDPACFSDNHRIFRSDLVLSLDVLFHLVEDKVFNDYMANLFRCSEKFVIIYSTNFDRPQTYHERHRVFTDWVEKNAKGWTLCKKIGNIYPHNNVDQQNSSDADFYIFELAKT